MLLSYIQICTSFNVVKYVSFKVSIFLNFNNLFFGKSEKCTVTSQGKNEFSGFSESLD